MLGPARPAVVPGQIVEKLPEQRIMLIIQGMMERLERLETFDARIRYVEDKLAAVDVPKVRKVKSGGFDVVTMDGTLIKHTATKAEAEAVLAGLQ